MSLRKVWGGVLASDEDESDGDIVDSGTCGDDLTWTLDEDGTLTISGMGAMEASAFESIHNDVVIVVIGDGVTTIGDSAFSDCGNMISVDIPNSVISIGEEAFLGCDSLTGINIPDSVITIENGAFYGCNGLTSIVIPDSVITIGNYAFAYCENLTNVDISASVTTIGHGVFDGCMSLMDIEVDEDNTVYSSSDGVLFNADQTVLVCCLPSKTGEYVIPDSVITIGDDAFQSCSGLTSIIIPDSVTTIGYDAFAWCESLSNIDIPDSVTTIGDYAFSGCISLTSIVIPNSVTTIGDCIFHYNLSLTNVNIPDSVTVISNYAFHECESLTSIDIPDSVTTIGDYAFSCTGLTGIDIPDSVITISDYAFAECISLTSVEIPDSVITIGEGAFYACSSMTSVTIGSGVTSIGHGAFDSCVSLTSVIIPDNVTSIDDAAFAFCENLTSVTIADSVTSIGKGAFNSCENLTDVYYMGSESSWNAINIGEWNGYLTGAAIHYAVEDTQIDLSACTISLSATSYTYDGKAKTPTVMVTYNGITLTKGTDYTATYSSNINAGTATVTITGCGDYTGTVAKNYTINKATQTITLSKTSVSVAVGSTSTVTAAASGGGSISWKSSSTSKATVSSGTIKGVAVGTATITVTAAATDNYKAATATVSVSIVPAAVKISSVANATSGITVKWGKVTGASGYYIYRKAGSGSYSLVKTITFGSTVSYTDTAVKSKSGTTYTYYVIAYYKNSSGTITKGTYSNIKSIRRLSSATISSLTNTSSGITVKWGKITGASGYYVYRKAGSGSYSLAKTITSASTVSWSDTAVKSKNGTTYTYYVIPYYKNSSGTITKGSYTATKKTVRLTAVSISSLKNSSSKKMTVKWAKNSKATGYQIQYSTSSSFASGNKTVTVSSASTVSKVISSLTKGKTYYVRIRAYKTVSGTKYYSAWSSKKSVKISK